MTSDQFKRAKEIMNELQALLEIRHSYSNFLPYEGDKGLMAELLLPLKREYCKKGLEKLILKEIELGKEFDSL